MKFLVLGAGAIGGYFGGRLVEAGGDVTFLVRPKRAEQLARDGLVIESDFGNLSLPVKVVTAGKCDPDFDVVIVACKACDLTAAARDIAPFIERGTMLLPLLNGIRHLDFLRETFGAAKVLGGTCHIAVTITPEGIIRHLNRLHSIGFGVLADHQSETAAAIGAIVESTIVSARLSPTILQDMWDKFVMLSALAGATCLMRASVGDIVRCEGGRQFIERLLLECTHIANAEGARPDTGFLERTLLELTNRESTLTSSMLRDLRRGGRTEADHILGDMARRAEAAGIDAPLVHAAYCHLQAYENGRQQ